MTPTAENEPKSPQLVHEEQPANRRFWVRKDHDYYASFDFVVMDGPYSKFTPVAGFNTAEEAHHYAGLMEKANQPEERTTDEAPTSRPDLDFLERFYRRHAAPHWITNEFLELIAYARHLEQELQDERMKSISAFGEYQQAFEDRDKARKELFDAQTEIYARDNWVKDLEERLGRWETIGPRAY